MDHSPGQSVFVFDGKKAAESFLCSNNETAGMPAVQKEQEHMSGDNRSLLLNWMLEVCHETIEWGVGTPDYVSGCMGTDVYFLAVSLYERYAATLDITFDRSQLIGSACIWIAFKFFDCRTDMDSSYLVDASANSFTVQQLVETERAILKALNWQLHVPTPLDYLEHLLDTTKHEGVVMRAQYFLELYSLMPHYAQWKPRDIAVACIVMGCKPQTPIDYNDLLETFNKETVMDILMDISHAHKMLTQQLPPFSGHMERSAIHIKYNNAKLPIVSYAELERRVENKPLVVTSYFAVKKKKQKLEDYWSISSSDNVKHSSIS